MTGPISNQPTPAQPSQLRANPKTGIRRLGKTPVWISLFCFALVLGVITVTLSNMRQKEDEAFKRQGGQNAGNANSILAEAPDGTAIPPKWPPPPTYPANPNAEPEKEPEPIDPNRSPMAIKARKEAWTDYFNAKNELVEQRRKMQMAALLAPSSGGGSPGNQGAGQPPTASDAEWDGATDASVPNNVPAINAGSGMGNPGMANGTGYGGMPGEPAYGPPRGLSQSEGLSTSGRQREFLNGQGAHPSTDYLNVQVTAPRSKYELKTTDIIPATLESGLSSDSPGIIKGRVARNVYDSATGTCILIPQGSTLQGTYDNAVSYGQQVVVVGWSRIIYPAPGNESLDIGLMPGANQSGMSGFKDITNNHYGQVFTNAILLSLFSAGVQLSQPQSRGGYDYSAPQVIGSAMGQQLGQLGMEYARRGLDIPPTNEVRNGYVFSILLTQDIAFERCWEPAPGPGKSRMVGGRR